MNGETAPPSVLIAMLEKAAFSSHAQVMGAFNRVGGRGQTVNYN